MLCETCAHTKADIKLLASKHAMRFILSALEWFGHKLTNAHTLDRI